MESEVVSKFFCDGNNEEKSSIVTQKEENTEKAICEDLSDDFLQIADDLNEALEMFKIPSRVECVYNPTIYARHTFEKYVRKYCNTEKSIMFFGMNPGPWGMSQSGVPFGDVSSVKEWLGISGPVGKPPKEIKARKIDGFECKRSEVSGKRFWGLFKSICGTPENFFRTSFVYNYLPQQWMKSNGCNITPGDLKSAEVEKLYKICDPFFIKVVQLYNVKTIVAVGKFCENRAKKALKEYLPSSNIQILYLTHPSPRTVNNTNWNKQALDWLEKNNLLQYYRTDTDK